MMRALNEVGAIVHKAALGAGIPVGQADDLARTAVHMAGHGEDLKPIVDALTEPQEPIDVAWGGDRLVIKAGNVAMTAPIVKDGFATAQQDMQARALVEARVDAQRMIAATQSALAADADLLEPAERAAIDDLIEAVTSSSAGADVAAIEAATQALAQGTEAFAAMRMNRGIQQALAGKKVEEM